MRENIVILKTQPEARGKVIAEPASALQKLADALAACTSALATAERGLRAAEAVLSEAAPAGFDHAAAGRAVAEARVADMLSGTATADGVQERCDRERAAAESASTAYAKRQADARAEVERSGPMIAALRAQAIALDMAVRRELVRLGKEKEAEAAQALGDAVAEYSRALIAFRALKWLQDAESIGGRGRQFAALTEPDLEMIVPTEIWDGLPAGWVPTSTRDLVRRDRYDLAAAVGERRREIMESATSGVYPKAGAQLHRADQIGGES